MAAAPTRRCRRRSCCVVVCRQAGTVRHAAVRDNIKAVPMSCRSSVRMVHCCTRPATDGPVLPSDSSMPRSKVQIGCRRPAGVGSEARCRSLRYRSQMVDEVGGETGGERG